MALHINPPQILTGEEARLALDAEVADLHRRAEESARNGAHGASAYWSGMADGIMRAKALIPSFDRETELRNKATAVQDYLKAVAVDGDERDWHPMVDEYPFVPRVDVV